MSGKPHQHRILLLCGKAGSGKDTSFEILKKLMAKYHPEVDIKQYAFGRPLKEIVVQTTRLYSGLELSVEAMNDLSYKETPIPDYNIHVSGGTEPLVVRKLLQQIGTDILRKHLGDDIFARAIVNQIEQDFETAIKPTLAVITDLRFPNELETVQAYCDRACYECQIVFIMRINKDSVSHNHSSESYYDQLITKTDLIIHNHGSLAELKRNIKAVILPQLTS